MFALKIKTQLLFLTLIPLSLLVMLIGAFTLYQSKHNLENLLEQRGQLISEQAALMSDFYFYTGNIPKLESVADLLMKIDGVVLIRFIDKNGQILLQQGEARNKRHEYEPFYTLVQSSELELSDFDQSDSEEQKVEIYGSILVGLSREEINLKEKQGNVLIIMFSFLALFIGLILSHFFSKNLKQGFYSLVLSAQRVKAGDYQSHCHENASGELLTLQKTFNEMIDSLALNEQDLQMKIDIATLSINNAMQELEQKNLELEQNKQETLRLAQSKAIADERTRIMRDMHDGIGGQLVSTLALLELEPDTQTKNNIETILKECLDDFRLIINSLNITANTLSALLADFKYRSTDKFDKMSVKLVWNVLELPDNITTDPQQSLHILRILQEAFTNILKHSNATEVTFFASYEQGRVTIEIKDNGKSVAKASTSAAHGLRNMHWRANELSGELTITPDHDNGFKVILSIPVEIS